jgi:mannosyltransferase
VSDLVAQLRQEKGTTAALLLIVSVAALLRFYSLAAESLWFDETYSVWVARHPVAWHIALSTQRIFPPLYYLCLHFWLGLGSSEFVVRSLSVWIGLGSIVAVYGLAKQLFDARIGLLSALLLAISPLHIWYSQEARMYILVATLGLCSAYFMLCALRQGRLWHWAAYILSTAALMNTHYFAIFLVPFQNAYVLYLLLRKQIRLAVLRHWLVSQAVVALLSVVGLAGIFSAESGYWWGLLDTWHGAPTVADLLSLMFSFSLGTTIQGRWIYWGGLFLFGLCVLASCFSVGRRRLLLPADRGLAFAGLYLAVPIGTVFALSQFRSFWVLRYIFPFLPPYCILVARGISNLWRLGDGESQDPSRKAATRTAGGALALLLLAAIVLTSTWPIANIYRYEHKENWRSAVSYLTAQEQPDDLILLVDEDIWLPFEHYYDGSTRRIGVSRLVSDRDLLAARVATVLPHYGRMWLVLSHTDNFLLKDYLTASQCTELVSEEHFTGIEVDLFNIQRTVADCG